MENISKKLFEELFTNEIKYLILRNFEKLPEKTEGTDLDILVTRTSFLLLIAKLPGFLKKYSLRIFSIIDEDNFCKLCIGRPGFGIQIDFFIGGVFYGKKELIPIVLLWEQEVCYNGVKVLSNEVSGLLCLLKEVLFNGAKKSRTKRIINKYQKVDVKIGEQYLINFSPEFNSSFFNLGDSITEKSIYELKLLSKKNFPSENKWNRIRKMTRIFKPPGYMFCFIGADGSGKSTIIQYIQEELKEAFHNGVHYEHLRPNFFPSLAKLFNKEIHENVQSPHSGKNPKYLISFVRILYYSLDYTLGYFLKVFVKRQFRASLWIFDRYFHDYFLDSKRLGVKLPNWIKKSFVMFYPKPDLVFCLGTEPQKIFARKPELPIDEIRRQINLLKRIEKEHGRFIWIDTGGCEIDTKREVLRIIHDYMEANFSDFEFEKRYSDLFNK